MHYRHKFSAVPGVAAIVLALTLGAVVFGDEARGRGQEQASTGFSSRPRPGRETGSFKGYALGRATVSAHVVSACGVHRQRVLTFGSGTQRLVIAPDTVPGAAFLQLRGMPGGLAYVIVHESTKAWRILDASERMFSESTLGDDPIEIEEVKTSLPGGSAYFGPNGNAGFGVGATRGELPPGKAPGNYVGDFLLEVVY